MVWKKKKKNLGGGNSPFSFTWQVNDFVVTQQYQSNKTIAI